MGIVKLARSAQGSPVSASRELGIQVGCYTHSDING